ncbi:hypothetical protein CHS0354_001651 [Potamilus streckersoni]|uniref:CAP-Gly domain-containing protein n=1 Tax=Potamilus streckersoni TaxID=2493646 RepID=A0AAE0SML2_9BIVA|nr:hypothetical protein CHS0354_001651 [Potamilus streckersoni]
MFRGRKVTDPKVHHGTTAGRENQDLAKAWNGIEKARSELRKIENRLGDFERGRLGPQLNETGETSITDYTAALQHPTSDVNQTYDIVDQPATFASGAVVDNYGRSAYMRSKTQGRGFNKVKRLDDKYITEDGRSNQNRGPKSHDSRKSEGIAKLAKENDIAMRDKNMDSNTNAGIVNGTNYSTKRVEPSNQRDIYNGNNIDLKLEMVGGVGGAHNRSISPSFADSTLIDSRDIRETDIRFLNNNLTQDLDVRWQHNAGPRLTHVSVTVPGSSKTMTTSTRYSTSETAHNAISTMPKESRQRILDLIASQRDADRRRTADNSSESFSDSETAITKKFKGGIKNIDEDGLAKLKEKIRQQQLNKASPRERKDELRGAVGGAMRGDEVTPGHLLHDEYDEVVPHSQDVIENLERQPLVRKVAAGPPAPSFKGFSETEVKYRFADRPVLKSDSRRKEKKRQLSVKLQEKRLELAGWLKEEEDHADKQRKPMTRVIAPTRKNAAKQKKDIITTSSWRTGQEAIIRELGPSRVKKGSVKSRDAAPRDTDSGNEGYDAEEERPEVVGEEQKAFSGIPSATALELEQHKALSEEARKVYSDLQLDAEERIAKHEEDREQKRNYAKKRKVSKSSEPEKQQPMAKQRHYDPKEVKKYIQKKKVERLKIEREEKQQKKLADEMRKRQLEELYSKQKLTSAQPVQHQHQNKPEKRPQEEKLKLKLDYNEFLTKINFGDLPRQHLNTDRGKDLAGGESDKENQTRRKIDSSQEEQDMDISNSSSTLTGDESVSEVVPTVAANHKEPRTQVELNTNSSSVQSGKSGETTASNLKSIHGIPFDMDGVMSKFTRVLHEKLNEEPPGIARNSRVVEDYKEEDNLGLPRSKADRIRALKETAATLQNRLQAETKKIQNFTEFSTSDRGASNPRHANRWDDLDSGQDFRTRYDRLTGANADYTVFKSNLPGSGPSRHIGEVGPVDNFTRTLNAFQNQTVPSSFLSKEQRGTGQKKPEDIGEESTITESSTFSEITITDESENDSVGGSPTRKIGTGLKERDFHGTRGGSSGVKPSMTELSIPRPSQAHHPQHSLDKPKPDPYNVFSIYARQQNKASLSREPQQRSRSPVHSPAVEEQMQVEQIGSQQKAVPSSGRTSTRASLSNRLDSQISKRSESPLAGPTSQISTHVSVTSRSESQRSMSPIDKTKSRQASVGTKVILDSTRESDEDTLEGESYDQTFESDSEENMSAVKSKSASVKLPQSHKSLPSHSGAPNSSVSIEEETELKEKMSSRKHSLKDESESFNRDPPRYSPNALEQRFFAELNQLESMETSMRQLTNVERTRAVSMAQQETVSLAQMLKARQLNHDRDMRDLSTRAHHEAYAATRQLEEARQRAAEAAINAAEIIAKVREEGAAAFQESARKLIETQTEAAKATAEAAKYLVEARAYNIPESGRKIDRNSEKALISSTLRQNISERTGTKQTESSRTASGKTTTQTSYSKETFTGNPKSTRTKSSSVKSSPGRRRTEPENGASIATATGAEGQVDSRSDSIKEDISQESADDYSVNFDESLTEDEIEERSFRVILPSESHRKKAKQHVSDNESVTSNEGSSRIDDLFHSEESFEKFTEDMVKQFMKEEELRAQHQFAVLRLREKALLEKTKAELAWLEQQKERLRNKGADDQYPMIVKKQRGLKMKLQEQQAELKRLRDANEARWRERQRILLQQGEKARQKKAKQTDAQVESHASGRLARPSEVHTEAEVSSIDEASDAEKRKNYKSDSEIYMDQKGGKKSKVEAKNVEKYKKIHLDEKYLTAREQKLLDRRRNAEELLKWKYMLDEEEEHVYKLEKKALKIWDSKNEQTQSEKEKEKKDVKTLNKKDIKGISEKEISAAQDTTIISEVLTTAKDSSHQSASKRESSDVATVSRSENFPDERWKITAKDESSRSKTHGRSGSESSIAEEIQSQSSMEDVTSRNERKLNDSSDDTYGNETFEQETATVTKEKSMKSPRSPLDKLRGLKFRELSSPRSPFSSKGRNSESESEDSISHTETQSDMSDFEGRVLALNEELRKRKKEADRLKSERKRKRKETMKSKEESLKKQIEAYDNQISQLKAELQKEMEHEPVKTSVRPQIKQPKVSPPKSLKKQGDTTPKQQGDTTPKQHGDTTSKQQKDLEGSRSDADSTQSSPSVIEEKEKDQKSISPQNHPSPTTSRVQLDKISEASESPATWSDKSEMGSAKSRVRSQENASVSQHEEKTDEIPEMIEQIEVSDQEEKSYPGISISLNKPEEDLYDVTYTPDFTEEPVTGSVALQDRQTSSERNLPLESPENKLPLSARTVTDHISENISEYVFEQHSEDERDGQTFDLNKTGYDMDDDSFIKEDRNEDSSESEPRSSRSISQPDSRPSSGRSESMQSQYSTESERQELIKLTDFERDEEKKISKKSAFINQLQDIDDLLGGPLEDEFDEELTPTASPRPTDEGKERLNLFDALEEFQIGDRVMVTGPHRTRKTGTILFKGRVDFAQGIWAGVELDEPCGQHDGVQDRKRYFTCRPKHGLLVPRDDVTEAPLEMTPEVIQDLRTSVESVAGSEMSDSELNQMISEADKNVQFFELEMEKAQFLRQDQKPSPVKDKARRDELADRITDELLESVIKEDLNAIGEIKSKQVKMKKIPPEVAPKPKKKPQVNKSGEVMNGNIEEQMLDDPKARKAEAAANRVVKNLLNDAISHILTIKSKRTFRETEEVQEREADEVRESGYDEEEPIQSPTEELECVLGKEDKTPHTPPRPGSPVPGSQPSVMNNEGMTPHDSGTFEDEHQFFDDDMWPVKAPPPYPGTEASDDVRGEISQSELQRLTDEVFYAVPHKNEEVSKIVSSAVDIFWNQRRCGEPIEGLEPPDSFFSKDEEEGQDFISNSQRVYKKLLFDLTREIIQDIYKEDDIESTPPWHKAKRRQSKYCKISSPPTTVDVLKSIVQEAIINTLGLNGAPKGDRGKWGIRKKKDHVDSILVQELREEEPQWVNYDDDEHAVKMQLTETIFESLLMDTVQTINKIYRRRQILAAQQEAK